MNNKYLLLLFTLFMFLSPSLTQGATVGGYFQIDVNVLRNSSNNPISLTNIALFRDEQPTYPTGFTGVTISEGYSYTSLYQTLTVGQTYILGFGKITATHLRAGAPIAGLMFLNHTAADCAAGCNSWGFTCTAEHQQSLVGAITNAEAQRIWGAYTITTGSMAPGYIVCNGNPNTHWIVMSVADPTLVTCTSAGFVGCPYGNTVQSRRRLCACGGWKIVVTI